MHNSKRSMCIVLILCCVLMTGCEKLKVLTAEEEEIITLYAAKVVAKHNIRLSQGIVRYRGAVPEEEEEESADTDEEESEEPQEEDTTEPSSEQSDTPLEEDTDDSSSEAEKGDPVTLTEALGVSGVTFTYEGASVPQGLILSDYYTLPDPAQGKEYVIVTYEIRNTATSPVQLSIADLRPVFTIDIDGESASAGIVLEDDLSTYEGTIEAGGSEDLIILFEVSDEAASDLSNMELSVDVNGQKRPLILQ